VYQRKLAALLQNGTATPAPEDNEIEHTNGNGTSQEEKYSDSEEEEEQQEQKEEEHHIEIIAETFIQPSAPAPTVTNPVISTPEPLTAIRKRVTERPPSSLSALPLVDRQVG
jgi:pyruvate/2-oxoglutarate dehydrogenase complex dihydrolipoamide acyltransferase (E2) component